MKRVLVTRSEPGASETAQRLSAMGFQPVVEPLFDIEPIEGVALPAFDALAFTSANGVRVFAKLSPRRDVPVFCVGARTADEARGAGFGDVKSADGDVSALARLIPVSLPSGARLLHSGNEESRGDLAGQLSGLGVAAAFVATFRAAAAKSPGPVLAAHLNGAPSFDAVLIHSPRAARILGGFLKPDSATATSPAPMNIAVISEAAAEPLRPAALRIEIALQPNEEALLKALTRLCDLG
jgi:uroporphyrinogen-III synthase